MSTARQARLQAIGRLFRYPHEDYVDELLSLLARLKDESSAAATPLARAAEYALSVSLEELEETYTRTFDLNPSCSPEIGWHLFGEEYVRGMFMVRMRSEMRARGLEESGELPDHLVHVLAVLGSMDEVPAKEFARACVCPAIGKMLASFQQSLEKKDAPPQPLRPLVEALAHLVLEEFSLGHSALEAREEETPASQDGVDPLHRSPCSGCVSPELVPLRMSTADGASEKESLR